MQRPSVLLRFGPYLFYLLELSLWMFFSMGILGAADIRKPLGLLGAVAVPVFGLFVLGSILYHTMKLIRSQYERLLPLLLINIVGTLVYIVLVFSVLAWARYS